MFLAVRLAAFSEERAIPYIQARPLVALTVKTDQESP